MLRGIFVNVIFVEGLSLKLLLQQGYCSHWLFYLSHDLM